MAKRARQCWVVLEGGPEHGTRFILFPAQDSGTFVRPVPAPEPGRQVPHRYELTGRTGPGGVNEAAACIARHIEALPSEPAPPRPATGPSLFLSHPDSGTPGRPGTPSR